MITTQKILKVFLLEDNPDDVELELHELRKGGFDVSFEVARNRKEFLEKLSYIDADIILADYVLPDITGIEAIHICREKKIDVPIIFITGMGNEQIAVDSLREGAIDYILKKHIIGLSARVSRAIEIWAERKAKEKAETERQKFQQLLFQAQKMESVGRLASGIAHDFNNLLTGILGFSELILQDIPKDSPFYERLQTISTLCKRAASLVKQLLIFGKRIPTESKKVNINSLIEETMGLIKHAIVKEGIEIRLNLNDDIPDILADIGQLSQVLINLALNATDAMDGKGILEFGTEKYCIARHAGKTDEYVCLSVSDTGSGIPDNNIQNIFDPFFTTKEVGKGTGLGLTIAYSIVNAHGGWINVNSELGKGTTFKIYLPAIQLGLNNVSADERKKMMMPQGNETILFVEDEEELRTRCASILNELNYKVLSASNSEEALDIYSSTSLKIDLIISDIIMPKKSGIDLFNELRSINPDIKFIFVTDYGLSEQIDYIGREANAVIKKPYNFQEMARVIRKVLDSPRHLNS